MAKIKGTVNMYSPKGRVKRGKHSKTVNKSNSSKPSVGQGKG